MIKDNTEKIKDDILDLLDINKALDITSIDLRGKTDIAEYMIITTSNSSRHSAALSEKIISMLKEKSVPVYPVEGKENCNWVLIDAADIIIHIFLPEIRILYKLEDMWKSILG